MKFNSSLLFRVAALGIAAVVAGFSAGCASPSTAAGMAPPSVMVGQKHAASVQLEVSGGSETSKMGASQISNADFKQAVRTAIENSAVFSKVADNGDYLLEVQIVRLVQPKIGFSFTVEMEATWRLYRQSDRATLWEKAITSSYTAKMDEAFAGTTRLRLANEGAARNNIEDALKQIGELKLN